MPQLNRHRVTPRFSGPRDIAERFVEGLHWVIRDARAGLVLEFVEGKLMTYEEGRGGVVACHVASPR